MVELSNIIAVLKAALSVEVHSDYIPETASLPAVSVSHVSNLDERVLNGQKARNTGVWRITISAPSNSAAEAIAADLEMIDNVPPTSDFTNLRVEFIQYAPKGIGEQNRRIFYDLFARK